eukprot:TRINITY_DN6163_c0_g1_i2.p1 TRINITY_DN6163_c0_g1~~TRINITY_DN6163_c0_g1_i2.p1  ORF type:complete len:550 (+),score=72.55 TRINITY_DN6163_c0_g1_i2:85-1650(+)
MMSSHAAVEMLCGGLMLISKASWLFGTFGSGAVPSVSATTILMRWLGCTMIASSVLGYSARDMVPTPSTDAAVYGITLYHALVTGIALSQRSEFDGFFVTLVVPSLHGFLTIGFALAAATGGSRSVRDDRRGSDVFNDTYASFVLSSSSASSFCQADGGYYNPHLVNRCRASSVSHKMQKQRRRSSTPTADAHSAELLPANDIECGVTTLQSVPVNNNEKEVSYCSSFDGGKLVSCVSSSDAMQSPNSFESVSVLHSRFPADFGLRSQEESTPHVVEDWSLGHSEVEKLSQGDTLFLFTCKVGSRLSKFEKSALAKFINMSGHGDHVPCDRINMNVEAEVNSFTFFITRAIYTLPNVMLRDLTIKLLSSVAYHTGCQPGHPKIWTDCLSNGDYDTFRITKSIVPMLFSMTIQFKCSLVPESELPNLSSLTDGIPVHKAVLMERTKRNNKPDMTKSCKSLLLYHQLPDDRGVLVFNVTGIANSTVPGIVASIIDRLGSVGSREAAETAVNTRHYLNGLRKGG